MGPVAGILFVESRSPKPNQREDSANGFRPPHCHLPYSPAYCNQFAISGHPQLNYKIFNVLAFLSTPASFAFTSVHKNYPRPLALPLSRVLPAKKPDFPATGLMDCGSAQPNYSHLSLNSLKRRSPFPL